MNHTEQRKKFRALLSRPKCVLTASVYDPFSARLAESVGYELSMVGASVVLMTTLGAPDIILHTLTEYADQVRRIMRANKLSLFVDADDGYGNALNVMRTIQELEHAGASGICIEDTTGPTAFGQAEGAEALRLVSIPEQVGKIRAAVVARDDPSTVIIARTASLKLEGIESAVARVKAYAAAGADALYMGYGLGVNLDHLRAIHDASKLAIMGTMESAMKFGTGMGITRDQLAECGVRAVGQGHYEIAAAVKAVHDTYTHLFNGGSLEDLKPRIASHEQMAQLMNAESYSRWTREYMS